MKSIKGEYGQTNENATAKMAVAEYKKCLACGREIAAGINLGTYNRNAKNEITGIFCSDCC